MHSYAETKSKIVMHSYAETKSCGSKTPETKYTTKAKQFLEHNR